jgi:hypothetical protein
VVLNTCTNARRCSRGASTPSPLPLVCLVMAGARALLRARDSPPAKPRRAERIFKSEIEISRFEIAHRLFELDREIGYAVTIGVASNQGIAAEMVEPQFAGGM